MASDALTEFVEAKLLTPPLVEEFLNCLDYVAIDAGRRGRLEPARQEARREAEERPRLLPVGGAAALRADRAPAGAGGDRHAGEPDRGGEAARARPRLGQGAERRARQAFRRGADLPDRPLSREGDGAEPDGDPLRQRAVRAARGTRTTSSRCRSPSPSRSGVEGRGAYYDKSGAMRDMVQNHMMQLLCLTAMEPPSKFDPDAVRDEKLKVIRALDPAEDERHGARAVPGERQGRRATSSTWATRRAGPRASSPSGRTSPTGAGRGRPSTCAPARSSRRGSARSA